MPIYEYRCKRCEDKFEVLVGFSGGDGVVCPRCGAIDIERCFSPVGIRSKGTSTTKGGSSCGTCKATSCATCH
jgi:putative FmdB family regulatory protein